MNKSDAREQIHATCVAIDGRGVILRGEPGTGKSDLALRLMDAGAILVADDRVDLTRDGDDVMATVPATIAGMIEARGVGIVRDVPHAPARLRLVVDLVARDEVPRLPATDTCVMLDIRLPLIRLHAFDISTPLKIRLALEGL